MVKKYCKCGKLLSKSIYNRCQECLLANQYGKNNPNFKHGLTSKKTFCVDCGKEKSSYLHDRCRKCHYKHQVGINHGNWKNGSSFIPYSYKFNNILKNKIRERDNHICQLCGRTEEENLEISKKKLNIHHIDYNKKNCNENNLISLCSSCHMKTHYNREKWIEYFNNRRVYNVS